MNEVFADMLDVCVVIYLDDILIFTDDPHKHSEQVREVLRWLRLHKLYAKPEKCEFTRQPQTSGLRRYSQWHFNGRGEDQAIQDWPEPRKVRDIQSFLGFANFYRRFIHNYSDICRTPTRLTRKNIKWEFDENCRTSFTTSRRVYYGPCLIHWRPDQQVHLETDASDYAIAGILSHQLEDGSVAPHRIHSELCPCRAQL